MLPWGGECFCNEPVWATVFINRNLRIIWMVRFVLQTESKLCNVDENTIPNLHYKILRYDSIWLTLWLQLSSYLSSDSSGAGVWLQMSMSATSSSLLEKFYIHLNVRRNNFHLIKSLEPFYVITLQCRSATFYLVLQGVQILMEDERINKRKDVHIIITSWSHNNEKIDINPRFIKKKEN